MLSPTPPTLSDGTKVVDLVNVNTREVQMRALSDPELYELEMERIFGRIWVFLGHESEIPASGDFMVRDMGSDSVLVTRDKAGEVHSTVLLPIDSRGLLAIGSHDENRFHPGMGTVFLKLIAEAITASIARYPLG